MDDRCDTRGPCPATAAQTPRDSRRALQGSQLNLHAIPCHLDPAPGNLRRLRRALIEYGIGVIDVYQNLACGTGKLLKPLEHSARPALGQVTDVAGMLLRGAQPD